MSQNTNNQQRSVSTSQDTTEIKNAVTPEQGESRAIEELTEEELANVAGGGFSSFLKHVVGDAENMTKKLQEMWATLQVKF